MPKLSVIIPVYNVEKYIEKCVRSLFEQTLTDIEYLFIDDCTPDRSIAILKRVVDEYAPKLAEDNKVVRIERMPKNCGQAVVRKYGIVNCTGDFVIQCDSDDWMEPTMYERMYRHAVTNGADLVFCDYQIAKDGQPAERVISKNLTDCSREGLLKLMFRSTLLNPLWVVMAKRKLFADILFPAGDLSEDKTIMMQLVWKARKASYLPEALYHYCLSDHSILRTVSKEANIRKFRQVTENRAILLQFFKREHIQVPGSLMTPFLFMAKTGNLEPFLDDPVCRRMWRETFPLPLTSVLINPYIPLKRKLRYLQSLLKAIGHELKPSSTHTPHTNAE